MYNAEDYMCSDLALDAIRSGSARAGHCQAWG